MINIVKTQPCDDIHTWAGTKVYYKDILLQDVVDLKIEQCGVNNISLVWVQLPLGTITKE